MRHVAAYLLLALGGNNNISAKDITDLLSSVGVEPNPQSLKTVIDSLKGKDLNELIAEGSKQLAGMPCGGTGGSAAAAPVVEEAKPVEEKKAPEPESESDEDMGLGLFD